MIQVGYYLFAHWLQQVRKGKKLQLIIPVIYYQGKQKWEVPALVKLFDAYPESMLEFIPRLEHILVSLNEISDQQINELRNKMLAAALGAQKFRFNPASLVEDFERILMLFPLNNADQNFLEVLVVYTFSVTNLTEKNISESLKNIPQPIKEKVMTTYDRLIEKGRLEGKLEKQTEIIIALYEDGIGLPQIAKYTQLSEDQVLKILKENGRQG